MIPEPEPRFPAFFFIASVSPFSKPRGERVAPRAVKGLMQVSSRPPEDSPSCGVKKRK